jgi:hypothetical protein
MGSILLDADSTDSEARATAAASGSSEANEFGGLGSANNPENHPEAVLDQVDQVAWRYRYASLVMPRALAVGDSLSIARTKIALYRVLVVASGAGGAADTLASLVRGEDYSTTSTQVALSAPAVVHLSNDDSDDDSDDEAGTRELATTAQVTCEYHHGLPLPTCVVHGTREHLLSSCSDDDDVAFTSTTDLACI